jgi:hypothetical protein
MKEAQVLGYNFEEMEKRELLAKQRFKETIAEYQEVILKLAGKQNLRLFLLLMFEKLIQFYSIM